MPRYHPGYDSRLRHKIGTSLEDLPEILRGIRRVQGWLELANKHGIIIPRSNLGELRTACDKVLGTKREN